MNLIDNLDMQSTAESLAMATASAPRIVAKMYDQYNIRTCLVQEINQDQRYYIDILDEEIANIALQSSRIHAYEDADKKQILRLSRQESEEGLFSTRRFSANSEDINSPGLGLSLKHRLSLTRNSTLLDTDSDDDVGTL